MKVLARLAMQFLNWNSYGREKRGDDLSASRGGVSDRAGPSKGKKKKTQFHLEECRVRGKRVRPSDDAPKMRKRGRHKHIWRST